jgi:hypothetical protein
MTDSSWPKGTGTQANRPPTPSAWERPDPPRLNDTSALVRKGIHPYELLLRGSKSTSPLETAWNAEHTFDKRGVPEGVISAPYGCGAVVAIRPQSRGRNGRTVDGNGSIPRKGTLADAVDCVEKC